MVTLYVRVAGAAPMERHRSFSVEGMRPGDAALPSMVKVFPLPVAPYANTVALKPSITPPTRKRVVRAYTSAVDVPCEKAWSNAYARACSRAFRIMFVAWWPGSSI